MRYRDPQNPYFSADGFLLPRSIALAIVFVFLAGLSSVIADTHSVHVPNPFLSTPFMSSEMAGTSIQKVNDVVSSPDATVLVADGTDDTSGMVVDDDLPRATMIIQDDDFVVGWSTAPSEQFVERLNSFDLDGESITFIPDGLGSYYYCVDTIVSLPTEVTLGRELMVVSGSDDTFERVAWRGGEVLYFGNTYNSLWVNSNGAIAFDGASSIFRETMDEHLSREQIALLWNDLNPDYAGMIRFYEAADRVVVSFDGVTEFNSITSNTFQAELFFDGRIRLSYLGIAVKNAIVGLSPGGLEYDSQTHVEEDFTVGVVYVSE